MITLTFQSEVICRICFGCFCLLLLNSVEVLKCVCVCVFCGWGWGWQVKLIVIQQNLRFEILDFLLSILPVHESEVAFREQLVSKLGLGSGGLQISKVSEEMRQALELGMKDAWNRVGKFFFWGGGGVKPLKPT